MVVPYERNLHEADKLPELKVRCERKADCYALKLIVFLR
ncbi:hypothetical protein BvCmsB7A_03802 [Escherichia coli]|nr:hypothetical protein BvCmsB7A_03802 [Escherichia coli]